MADARPTFPLSPRYTQAQTEAVQPPDDRTYSAEVTSFPSNLLHHRSARIIFPYTRSNIVTFSSLFVKHYFCIFLQSFYCFFVNIATPPTLAIRPYFCYTFNIDYRKEHPR